MNSNCSVQRQLNQTTSEELSKTAAVWDKREFNCIREDTAYNRVAEFQVIFTEKNWFLVQPPIERTRYEFVKHI